MWRWVWHPFDPNFLIYNELLLGILVCMLKINSFSLHLPLVRYLPHLPSSHISSFLTHFIHSLLFYTSTFPIPYSCVYPPTLHTWIKVTVAIPKAEVMILLPSLMTFINHHFSDLSLLRRYLEKSVGKEVRIATSRYRPPLPPPYSSVWFSLWTPSFFLFYLSILHTTSPCVNRY